MQSTLLSRQYAAFWDKTAAKYSRKRVAEPAAFYAKFARGRVLLRAGDRMLKIGCSGDRRDASAASAAKGTGASNA